LNIGQSFVLTGKSSIEGIISYLISQHDGNVHDRGIVNISALDPYGSSSSHRPKNVADLTATNTFFLSKDQPNQMLIYDFQKLRIKPPDYLIRSFHSNGVNGQHLKSWVIEVSSDASD
jgi:hypothetical protein